MAENGFGLYIHWPYCLSKCPYCDFNSHIAGTVDHSLWAEMYCREMETLARRSGRKGLTLDSIFVGGGTPSLMSPDVMAQVLDHARSVFRFTDQTEITMEANPTSVEASRLKAFASAGIGRLSLGIQALDDEALSALGRNHSHEEALQALKTAQSIFPRVSADFIYARPNQTPESWQKELAQILDLGLSHLSLYQLTLEPGTAFFSRHQRGLLTVPDDDAGRRFYDLTSKMTDKAGLSAYEISNHAASGQECRHNLIYWRAGDWLGIGPGAHGRYWLDDQRIETRSRRDPAAWLDDVSKSGTALDVETEDTPFDTASEIMMMGLRLKEGVDLERLSALPGFDPCWITNDKLDHLAEGGLIDVDKTVITLTEKGRPVINAVLGHLLG